MRSRQATCDAVSQLSFYAPYYTLKSTMAWFDVSRRQVFKARVHAMMFGPGIPVRLDAAQAPRAWRIPAEKLDTLVQLLTDGGPRPHKACLSRGHHAAARAAVLQSRLLESVPCSSSPL